jgi:hypothetical protein
MQLALLTNELLPYLMLSSEFFDITDKKLLNVLLPESGLLVYNLLNTASLIPYRVLL